MSVAQDYAMEFCVSISHWQEGSHAAAKAEVQAQLRVTNEIFSIVTP